MGLKKKVLTSLLTLSVCSFLFGQETRLFKIKEVNSADLFDWVAIDIEFLDKEETAFLFVKRELYVNNAHQYEIDTNIEFCLLRMYRYFYQNDTIGYRLNGRLDFMTIEMGDPFVVPRDKYVYIKCPCLR